MAQEEKQLLLKDLCSRLPYGVKYQDRIEGGIHILSLGIIHHYERFIPYLRSLSSMTDKEKSEVGKIGVCDDEAFHNDIYDIGISMEEAFTAISWFLERHFDINYLIEKGLALEASEEMYKTE